MREGEMVVTEKRHVSFLFTWLREDAFCDSSLNMIKECKKWHLLLLRVEILLWHPFSCLIFYHGCTEIIMGRFPYERGPFWILQFWLQSYFPEFRPASLDNCNLPTYGYLLDEGKKLLFPDPMVLKAVLSLQENLARI